MGTISPESKLEVFFRDRWLCHFCGRPTIFHWSLKQAEEFSNRAPLQRPAQYFNERWRRDLAPLLDELAAVVDHLVPLAAGGSDDTSNLVTSCARCNQRKSSRSAEDYLAENPRWVVKGKHGEPERWDGLTALFLALCDESGAELGPTESTYRALLADRLRGGT